MFSKACQYGIKACTYIALQSLQKRRVNIKDIAKEINSPEAFTAKILQKLAKNNIVNSVKGPSGGFFIERENIEKIKLGDIVFSIDGDSLYNGCGLGLAQCNSEKPCPMHDKFVHIRGHLKTMLQNTNLYELASGINMGATFLKN